MGSSWGSPSHGDSSRGGKIIPCHGSKAWLANPKVWKNIHIYLYTHLFMYNSDIYIYITYYILYITYYIWLWYILSVLHYILYMTMIYIIYHILHITYYIWLWYIYDINDHCVDLHLPDLSLPTCSDDLQHLRRVSKVRKRAPSLRKNIGLMLVNAGLIVLRLHWVNVGLMIANRC